MEELVFTGKTVEEAISNAVQELKVEEENLQINVLEEAKKGIFGLGAKLAKISVEIKKEKEIAQGNDGQRAEEFLKGLFEYLDVTADVEVIEEENLITVNLKSDKSGSIIGYRGEILDSLQTLAGAVANKGRENYRRVVVNCEGYREKREEILKNLALKLAQKAVDKGRIIKLEPMTPSERRIIHSALADREDVKTESEGKDPARFVVIIPNNLKKFDTKSDYRKGGYTKNSNGSKPKFNASSRAPRKSSGFGAVKFLGNSFKKED